MRLLLGFDDDVLFRAARMEPIALEGDEGLFVFTLELDAGNSLPEEVTGVSSVHLCEGKRWYRTELA